MVNDIENPTKYNQLLFYASDSPMMGAFEGEVIQKLSDKLDSASYLHVDTDKILPAEVKIADEDENISVTKKNQTQGIITRLTLDGSEYISTVARQFGTTTEAIQELNPGVDLIHTFSGQKIRIPGTLKHPENGQGHISEDSHNMILEDSNDLQSEKEA